MNQFNMLPIAIIRKQLTQFLRCTNALAAIEFALLVPIMMLLLLGIIEYSRILQIKQRMDHATNMVADTITQQLKLCPAKLMEATALTDDVMEKYLPTARDFKVIFSSVVSEESNAGACDGVDNECISWQFSDSTSVPPGLGSRIGLERGAFLGLPGGMQVIDTENYITVEVIYGYRPLLDFSSVFLSGMVDQEFYDVAIFKPRVGDLATLETSCN